MDFPAITMSDSCRMRRNPGPYLCAIKSAGIFVADLIVFETKAEVVVHRYIPNKAVTEFRDYCCGLNADDVSALAGCAFVAERGTVVFANPF